MFPFVLPLEHYCTLKWAENYYFFDTYYFVINLKLCSSLCDKKMLIFHRSPSLLKFTFRNCIVVYDKLLRMICLFWEAFKTISRWVLKAGSVIFDYCKASHTKKNHWTVPKNRYFFLHIKCKCTDKRLTSVEYIKNLSLITGTMVYCHLYRWQIPRTVIV